MDYAVSGAQKGPDQFTIPYSLFPIPCSLFPVPYSLPLPFRPQSPAPGTWHLLFHVLS
jgi:hypothetical protein